jgi:hypothetical protein
MNHLRSLGNRIAISIKPDRDGFTGRECPNTECEGYFKVQFGTGLKGKNLPCHCPYCGCTEDHGHFWTKEQIKYAKSLAIRKITEAVTQDLKSLEFNHPPRGAFGIGISMKVKTGTPPPIRYYREKQLETEVICDQCTLRYAIYGVFAFCPDCGQHNSLQILIKNLEVAGKMLDMVANVQGELADRLIENALEDCVSAFDGFGRELCRVCAKKAAAPAKAEKASFQNLEGARQAMQNLYSLDLEGVLAPDEWAAAVQGFQKRHVVAHKMGVVDEEYVRKTGDLHAVVGHKVAIGVDEIRELVSILIKLARGFSKELRELP